MIRLCVKLLYWGLIVFFLVAGIVFACYTKDSRTTPLILGIALAAASHKLLGKIFDKASNMQYSWECLRVQARLLRSRPLAKKLELHGYISRLIDSEGRDVEAGLELASAFCNPRNVHCLQRWKDRYHLVLGAGWCTSEDDNYMKWDDAEGDYHSTIPAVEVGLYRVFRTTDSIYMVIKAVEVCSDGLLGYRLCFNGKTMEPEGLMIITRVEREKLNGGMTSYTKMMTSMTGPEAGQVVKSHGGYITT